MKATTDNDDWGRDPGVRRMRGLFGKLEEAQKGFLEDSSLSPLDERLKVWRREALKSFEGCWSSAVRKGIALSDRDAALLYVTCLSGIIQKSGVKIPSWTPPANKTISRILEGGPK